VKRKRPDEVSSFAGRTNFGFRNFNKVKLMNSKNLPPLQALREGERIGWLIKHCIISELHARVVSDHWGRSHG